MRAVRERTPSMRRCINCDESDAAAYGRRTNLEARRLLGVEAEDAGLRCRAAAAARLRVRCVSVCTVAMACWRHLHHRHAIDATGNKLQQSDAAAVRCAPGACAAVKRRRQALLPARAAASGWAYRRPLFRVITSTGPRCVQRTDTETQWHKQQVADS